MDNAARREAVALASKAQDAIKAAAYYNTELTDALMDNSEAVAAIELALLCQHMKAIADKAWQVGHRLNRSETMEGSKSQSSVRQSMEFCNAIQVAFTQAFPEAE
jgi:hypothetical protein